MAVGRFGASHTELDDFPAADLAADRRVYLPLAAFAAATALVIARLRPKAIAPVPVLVLTAIAFGRTQVFNNDESLWWESVRRLQARCGPGSSLRASFLRTKLSFC